MRKPSWVPWKRVLKFTGIVALAVFLLFGVASWVVFRQRNTLVLEQLQAYLAQSQSGQLTIGAIDLRIFRDFPDISIELDSVRYYEHRDSLRSDDERAILAVDRVFVAVGLWSLLNNRVEISEISIQDGAVNLTEYSPGVYNLNRALAKPRKSAAVSPQQVPSSPRKPSQTPSPKPPAKPVSTQKASLAINLEDLFISNVRLRWLPFGKAEENAIQIRSIEAEVSETASRLAISLQSRYHIDTARVGDAMLPSGDVSIDLRGEWDKDAERLAIQETRLSLDVFSIEASGTYDHKTNGKLDLQLRAESNDLPLLESLLRQDVIQSNRDLLRSGDLFVNGRLFGELRKRSPKFDLAFGMRNLSFRLPGAYGSFRDLGFEGTLSSGEAADYSDATLHIRQLTGQVPGGFVKGDIRISNAVNPWLHCNVDAAFSLDGYDKTFRFSRIRELEGAIEAHLRFDGPMRMPWPGNRGTKATFDGRFAISRLSFLLGETGQRFRELACQGRITSGNKPDQSDGRLEISGLKGEIPGGQFLGDIRIANFVEPFLHYRLSADVNLAGYDQVFQLQQIRNLQGKAAADLRFDGNLALIGTHAMDSSRSSTLRLDSVSFQFVRGKKKVSGLRAMLKNQNNLAQLDLAFRCGDSDLQFNAEVENLMHRVFGRERIVQSTGRVSASQFFTQDLILDSARRPIVDDRISDLSFGFAIQNQLDREDTLMNTLQFAFDIHALTARLDKLPNLGELDAKGSFRHAPGDISLDLQEMNLTLPQGRIAVSGDMKIPAKRRLDAHARIKLNDFPVAYIADLVAEIKDGREPSHKTLPRATDRLTGELDVTASMRTYPFDFRNLEVRNSQLTYTTADSKAFSVARMDASLQPLSFIHPHHSGAITGLERVQGKLTIERLKIPGLIDLNASFGIDGKNDTLQMEFVSTSRKAASEGGSVFLDFSSHEPSIRLRYDVQSTPVEDIVRRFSPKKFLTGTISYTLALQTNGSTWTNLRTNLAGSANIQSGSLDLYGVDIDDALTKFEKSQKFNLTDLGAVVLVGPIGIVATKGSDFVALATIDVSNRQHTHIQELAAGWKLDDLVLQTTDVAFATAKNRIAFDGAIDLARDSIPGIRIAVIDKNGCSLMDQALYGKFSAIKTGKLNIAKTLLGSVTNFVDAIVGKDCVPVYRGKVQDPKNKI